MAVKNPADLLADILEAWAVPGQQAPEAVRGFNGQSDVNAWRETARAAELVRTVDTILTGMKMLGEDISAFEPSLGAWYAGIYFAATPWSSGNPNDRYLSPAADLKLLRALGRVIEAERPYRIGEQEQRSLADLLDQASELLDADTDLPIDVRRYLVTLIDRARMVVKNLEEYGHEAVRQVALELGGALTIQAERAEQHGQTERASRLRSAGLQIMLSFVGGATGGAAQEVTGHVVQQLTQK